MTGGVSRRWRLAGPPNRTAWLALVALAVPLAFHGIGHGQTYAFPYGVPPASAPEGSVPSSPASSSQSGGQFGGGFGGSGAQNGQGGQGGQGQAGNTNNANQPIALTEPGSGRDGDVQTFSARRPTLDQEAASGAPEIVKPPLPNEFEVYVKHLVGRSVPRFGEALLTREAKSFEPPSTTTVPPSYALNPGDELRLHLTGAVESELRLVIDSDGRVFIPKVGSVNLAGVTYGDAKQVLTARVGRQFRNFTLSVSIGRLHAIRVYVTGYATKPGAYTVSSLSTLVNAVLAAGGPSPGGSFRSVQLRRNGQVISDFDLYDLLLKGDKSHDQSLQNEDVLYIAPVGPEVALVGSVNVEAIYESKSGESLGDLLRFAGGSNTLADTSRTVVQRLVNLDRMGWEQLDMAAVDTLPVARGDVLRVLSNADIVRPLERQAVLVTIEGEVARPGRYYLPPGSNLGSLLQQSGGLTPQAFVFGSQIDRISVQRQQQAGFDEAIRNLELSVAAAPAGVAYGDAGTQAAARSARASASRAVIDQLKARKPDGRLILALAPDASALPEGLALENDDRIYVPAQPTTIGVFGAVYQQGSFLYKPRQTIGDYLRLAGGPQRLSERSEVFVVRADGSVVSRQQHRWSSGFYDLPALPGDVVFVPIKTDPTSAWDKLKDITQVVYQLGLGAAALKVLSQ